MPFVPSATDWLKQHFLEVPDKMIRACGPITGKKILDIGCGDMLSDFALLANGASDIVGLDLVPSVDLPKTYRRLRDGGFYPPEDYANRMTYLGYDGQHFPVEDHSFDIVSSWGAFEHFADPLPVLCEAKRVCRKDGMIYVNVFPWWPCFYGSHLTDYIAEPFFHLKHDRHWVRRELDKFILRNPGQRDVVEEVYSNFLTLNHYSASMFSDVVRQAGLRIGYCSVLTYPHDISQLADDVAPMDAVICGTEMVLLSR
jgi:ubiquinone/menaquinone biosynthesis C-methylase UbiE